MKDLKVKDWFVFGEWYKIFWFHSCYFIGQVKIIKKWLGYGLNQAVAEQEGDVQRIYFSRSEWSNIGKRYLFEIIARPEKLEKLLSANRKAADNLRKFCENLKKINVENLKPRQLSKIFKQYHYYHHELWTLGQVPNVLELENSFFADYLKLLIEKKDIGKKETLQAFQTLTMPRELSASQKEEREMLRLVSRPYDRQVIVRHWKKFYWLNFGWTGPGSDLEYFIQVFRGLKRQKQTFKQALIKIKRDKEIVKEKKVWIKRLALSAREQKLFRLLEELLFMKVYRMDALFFSFAVIQPFLQKIAKDNFLSLKQVYHLPQSYLIQKLSQNKLNIHEINDIAKYSVRYFDGKQINLLVGEKALEIAKQIKKSLPKEKNVSILKGECAFPGKVSGVVKIVNFAEEMKKFEEGDILVSYVTDPSLLPIMKKASAFVTNTGGLTCHAAIVARELQIPCVIGTKIATRVFKDGDRVEVDANKGTVKKL